MDVLMVDQFRLEQALFDSSGVDAKKRLYEAYIDRREMTPKRLLNCLFSGYEWLNVDEDLTLNHLSGRIVILDFFTYCCINCMHILPSLHELEEKYEPGKFIVVGVHSAKFKNERVISNINNAISRYGITHPVVNDPAGILWEKFGVHCWPTLVAFGPGGNILFSLAGEGNKAELFEFCSQCFDYYDAKGKLGKIDSAIPIRSSVSTENTLLTFPSKISVSPKGDLVAISSHHHILIVHRATNVVKHVIGGHDRGNVDGAFCEAKFNSPHGTAWYTDEIIYAADTQNHTIRKISLEDGDVVTVAGTGRQVHDRIGRKIGTKQGISSPWDLTFSKYIKNILFVAMAGTHQLWALFLEDVRWIDSERFEKWTCKNFAGTGVEGNRNNYYSKSAMFAQPSGLCTADSVSSMFVADSESSSIRAVDLKKGRVTGVVGGDENPKNLFSYGDVDGTGTAAKLQHPLGVSWNDHDKRLYVADSYNHKIKVVNVEAKTCVTLECDVELNEPGGLCVVDNGNTLLVADTNNHRVMEINLTTLKASPLSLVDTETDSADSPSASEIDQIIKSFSTIRYQEDSLNLTLIVQEDGDVKMNKEAPHYWSITKKGSVEMNSNCGFQDMLTGNLTEILLTDIRGNGTIEVSACIYACSEDKGNCVMKKFSHMIDIAPADSSCKEKDNDARSSTIVWSLDNNSS